MELWGFFVEERHCLGVPLGECRWQCGVEKVKESEGLVVLKEGDGNWCLTL